MKTISLKSFLIFSLFLIITYLIFLKVKTHPQVTHDPSPLSLTSGTSLDIKQLREQWNKDFEKNSPQTVYANFKTQLQNQNFANQHLAAHLFGQVLYQKMGIDGIKICDSSFAFGCYHAFFGSAITDKGLSVLPVLDKGCTASGEGAVGCQHGIGHGLLEFLGKDKLKEALNYCDSLTKLNPYFGCSSGVFMEYNEPIELGENTAVTRIRELDKNTPYDPCDKLDKKFQESCYHGLPQLWDKTFDKDYARIAQLCSNLSDSTNRVACYNGIGSVAAPSSDYQTDGTIAKCDLISEINGRNICKVTAAWSFLPQNRAGADAICKDLPAEVKKQCPTSNT